MSAAEDRPLAGVPIAIKDDMPVAGPVDDPRVALIRPAAAADGEVVRRLRAAGAIPIGITNVPELMIFPWTATAANGVTRNPWDPTRTPGGSSGGSAAAVGVRDGSVRDRLGRRRLAPDPGGVLRAGRDEAEPRARLDAAGARGVARAERVRRARADRRRQRAAARRDPRVAVRGTPTPRRRSPGATSTPRPRRPAGCGSGSRASCRRASSRGCRATSAARGSGPARSSPSSGTR